MRAVVLRVKYPEMEQERPPGPLGAAGLYRKRRKGSQPDGYQSRASYKGASLPGILESVRRPVFVLQVERVPAIAGRTRAGSKKGHFMGVSQILAYIIYHASMCGGL